MIEHLKIMYIDHWYIVLILSILGGVFGRLGGWEHGNRLFRTIGVPSCCCALLLLGGFHWSIIFCFGTILGASTTYFKKKGADAAWWNWVLVGLVEGIAILPFAFETHHWIGFGVRTFICALLVCLWDILIGWDVLEESGRYFIITATIPLIFL